MSGSLTKLFTHDTPRAWMASFLFHLLLLIVLYLTHAEEIRRAPGFMEVTLGTLVSVPLPQPTQAISDFRPEASARSAASIVTKQSKATQPDLPERKYPVADEVLRLPEPKKLEVTEQSEGKTTTGLGQRLLGEKEFGAGKSLEEKRPVGEGERGATGEGPGLVSPTVGSDIGRTIGYSIQWLGAATRQKISGELPTYPEGVNIEAQIRLLAIVAPDGMVKSLQPIQKAHVKLEEAGMKEVRFWKFEPLSSTQPQIDQTCTITFNFKLK